MGSSSYVQTSFLGGQWSPFMQGRYEHPRYKTALKTCVNAFPTETGAWTRRPGFRFQAFTRAGAAGRMIAFKFSAATPYNIELTSGHLRLYSGVSLVTVPSTSFTVSAISGANPAVVQTSAPHGYSSGMTVQFSFASPSQYQNPTICAVLRNRQFLITVTDSTHFSIADLAGNVNVDGSTVNFNSGTVATTVVQILDIAAPWTGTDWQQVRLIQNQNNAILLHPAYAPQQLTITPGSISGGVYPSATAVLTTANLLDGPYYPINSSGAYLQPTWADATKPNQVQLFVSYPTYSATTAYNVGALVQYTTGDYLSLAASNLGNEPDISPTWWQPVDAGYINNTNGQTEFSSADIGRHVRLLSQPPLWVVGTTYAANAVVTYNGAYYTSQAASNVGEQPDTQPTWWLPTASTSVATWTWGIITAIGTGLNPRMTINVYGPSILYTTNNYSGVGIYQFQLGLYGGGGGAGFPSCGTYHEGRLWMAGAVANRADSSNSNDFLNMAPTIADGTVTDANGVNITVNASDINQFEWLQSSDYGMIAGTKGAEWRIAASSLDDPITPSSVQARIVTKYGCANLISLRVGHAVLFVQKFLRALYEMITEPFTYRVTAQSISYAAKDQTTGQIAEIDYQTELVPIVWARMANGGLSSCTYRRINLAAAEEPEFFGWAPHTHGQGNAFDSICVGATPDGSIDVLSAVTYNSGAAFYQCEFMTPLFDEAATYTQAFFMDGATTISGGVVTTVGGVLGLQLYGLWPHNGNSPRFFLGGLDCGTKAVSGGTAFIPFGTYDNVALNLAYIQSVATALNAGTLTAGNAGCFVENSGTAYAFTAVVGYPYTSQGQTLPPIAPQETGAQAGPAFGKLKRTAEFAIGLYNAVSEKISVGTSFSDLRPMVLRSGGGDGGDGTEYNASQLYTGRFWDTLDDDYGFDSSICWQISSPYPLTVTAIGGFVQTQDR